MRFFLILFAILGIGAGSADARDFGYEKFADVVSQVYGSQYGVVVPFFEMPDASDTARLAEGYPGSIWNLAVAKGRTSGTISRPISIVTPLPLPRRCRAAPPG